MKKTLISTLLLATSSSIAFAAAPVAYNPNTTVDGNMISITGQISDNDGDINTVAEVMGQLDCELTSDYDWYATFSCVGGPFDPGAYRFAIAATDDEGTSNEPWLMVDVNIEEIDGGNAPVVDGGSAVITGNVVTIYGAAHDIDGDMVAVVPFDGPEGADILPIASGYGANYQISYTDLPNGNYTINVIAVDQADHASDPFAVTFTVQGGEPVNECITAANSDHAAEGRATVKYGILYYSLGGNSYLGYNASTTTSLEETAEGVWMKVSSCN